MTEIDFDLQEVQPSVPFEVLPAGWYPAQIISSEEGESAAGDRKLKIVARVMEDHPNANRQIFIDLNMWHPNEEPRTYARRDYAAICKACGVVGRNTEELHMIPLAIKLKVRPAKGDYPASNQPCGFDAYSARFDGAPARTEPEKSKPAATEPAAATKPAAKPNSAPWKK